jgi:hypothetical protein
MNHHPLIDHDAPADLAALDLSQTSELCVEAFFSVDRPQVEGMQVLAAQWALRPTMDAFSGYDAGHTDGLNSKGYFGAVFDGRHIYFAPQFNGEQRHGTMLRYDSQAPFASASSWHAYNAGATGGLATKGYYGAVHAPPYIYYVPRTDGRNFHTRLLRFDTRLRFNDPSSWQVHDIGPAISYQGAAFDGRYIYLAPGYDQDTGPCGKVLRCDTQGAFDNPSTYSLYDAGQTDGLGSVCYDGAVYDGRYIYFAPLNEQGIVLRCDTRADFSDPAAWSAHEASANGLALGQCVGAVYDGRYVYFVPYAGTAAVRYDTLAALKDSKAWQARDITSTCGLPTEGYDGGLFDGRYLYYIPFWDGKDTRLGFHNRLLRYDTLRDYHKDGAWDAVDAGTLTTPSHPGGFNGGAFDGRHLYFAPWRQNPASGDEADYTPHGIVMRYDSATPGSVFALKACECGHNGGLGAALPGPTFYIQTSAGLFGVRANRPLTAGKHYLAGIWDGSILRLYVDGELVDSTEATGTLAGDAPLGIGRYAGGGATFSGTLDQVRISLESPSAAQTAAAARCYL